MIYSDSIGIEVRTKYEMLRNWQLFLRYGDVQGHQDWRLETLRHSMQNDSHSCVICAMTFAEELLKSDPKLTRININSQRRNIIHSLVAGVTLMLNGCKECERLG